ncbi:MAG: beta-lactamase class A-like protein beta-lactamase [Candidatus Doudnabacteria bacterium]|nr:beta-lactamase class A-like protein beta-lactamase [Candidatus Doudnabacteria bacterium]
MINYKDRSTILVMVVILVIGITGGYSYAHNSDINAQRTLFSAIMPIRDKTSSYKYVSSLLAYDVPENKTIAEYKPLHDMISSYISTQKSNGKLTQASVYYRSLDKGNWVGVNENEKYVPASLFKVPILMGYLKDAEEDPNIMSKKLKYEGPDQNANESIKPSAFAQPGKEYDVKSLLDYMIKYSDNNATYALFAATDKNSFAEIFSDLGIVLPTDLSGGDFISVKDYSLFFRILYNSTYLTKDFSDQALGLMTQSDFNEGIVAGVPQGTVVAHKFGEYAALDSNGQTTERELHDCGIVYGPKAYLLCVMTKGQNLDDLKTTIQHISEQVYKTVG